MKGERYFYYQLAEHLHYVSVELMLDEVSSQELTEWQAYFNIKRKEQAKEEAKQKARSRGRG